jgi:hypothetical protein
MKTIFISMKVWNINNSAGGGNFFVENLKDYLINLNYKVVFVLQENIDIILVIDPRKNPIYGKQYSIDEIIQYKNNNPQVKIIHRVNECDIKREIQINLEPLLIKTMKIADHVVFISEWLENYFINKYNLNIKSSSILNGCNQKHFFPLKEEKFKDKIKIITHHFSNNYLKGFHIYNELDKILPKLENIEFTYVGNYNDKYKPHNIKLLPCTGGIKLGDIIRQHDIYLTATQNEPGGMHHIEAQSCGLPILFCKGGGGVKEVCENVGEEFSNIEEMLEKLNKIKNNYNDYVDKIDYDFLSSERCCKEYLKIIESFNI